MRWLRHPVVGGVLVAALVSAGISAHRLGRLPAGLAVLLEQLELWTLDLRFELRGPRPPGGDVAILAFDDRTMEADPSLWERRTGWARVVRAAKAVGAKVVGLDALFLDPERPLPPALAGDIALHIGRRPPERAEDPAELLLDRVHAELSGDERLAAALAEAGNVVLALHAGDAPPVDDAGLGKGRYGQSTPGEPGPRAVSGLKVSLPALNRAARALGFATATEDETNTVRWLELARSYREGLFVPMGVQVVAQFLDVGRGRLAYVGPRREVRIGDRGVVWDGDDRLWLNFRGPAATFPTYPLVDLVDGKLPDGALAGKIALVGMTFLGHDRVRAPFGAQFPGVEIHATMADNLLRGDWLTRAGWRWDAFLCLAVGLLVALAFWPGLFRSPALQLGSGALALAAFLAGSFWFFSARAVWVSWVGPCATFALTSVAGLALSYLGEGLMRRRLRGAFAHYLHDEVIRDLLGRPQALTLGGERRTLTVLFSDIRDFTAFSESLAPLDLVRLLNTYLTPMTRAVLGRRGLLDKYIGDAVMAVFGAPVPAADHAAQALSCVLDMHREVELLKPAFAERGVPLAIGVGINTGEMVVGNLGSAERFNYTVAGDAVNLASRLEGLTNVYGVFCLIGDAARRAAGPGFAFRELDLVQVKGRLQAVAVHELLGGPEQTLARYQGLETWDAGLAAWRAGRFPEARAAFGAFAAANPADSACRLYLARLAELGDTPPEGWTGVFVQTSK